MSLPILETPKYNLIIPSTGKKVEYRPFLVKEEKILLMAQESNTQEEMLLAMKDIIQSCLFNKVNADELTTFDLEYIFLKLRSKSVGETASVKIPCDHCEEFNPVEINIDDVEITSMEQEPNVMLTDKIGITLRHLRLKDVDNLVKKKKSSAADQVIDTIIASIDTVFTEETVNRMEEATYEEASTFVNSLNRSQISKIENFISNAPKTKLDVSFCCEKCQKENEIEITGIQSFFE